jgi:hypothetical protein
MRSCRKGRRRRGAVAPWSRLGWGTLPSLVSAGCAGRRRLQGRPPASLRKGVSPSRAAVAPCCTGTVLVGLPRDCDCAVRAIATLMTVSASQDCSARPSSWTTGLQRESIRTLLWAQQYLSSDAKRSLCSTACLRKRTAFLSSHPVLTRWSESSVSSSCSA